MNPAASFASAATEMADGMARTCRLYGVSPLLGRLYAALFLATQPQSLEQLCVAVSAAKSSVSVALRKLESARVARRLPPRNDRRDFYEAITDPWVMLGDWTTLYFTPELEMFRETGSTIELALNEAGDAPGEAEAAELRQRVTKFREFAETFEAFLRSVNHRSRPKNVVRRIPITIERPKS